MVDGRALGSTVVGETNGGRVAAALLVRDQGGGPVIYAKWRAGGAQVERRVARGWLVPDGDERAKTNGKALGAWRERKGRPTAGHLSPDAAREALPDVIAEWGREHAAARRIADRITFADSAAAWIDERGAVAGWKATTARNYRAMLAREGDAPRHRGSASRARIMRAFGTTEVAKISDADIRAFLRSLDRDPALGTRSINAYRHLLSMVLAYAAERGWRDGNPVERVPKRREPDPAELIVYTPEQVHAVARHAQDETVAGIIITAAMTGLRMGEALELRWRDVHFSESVVHVQRSYAAGLGVSSPKGRRGRSVPLADQVAQVLARLGQRERFTGRNALIFATPTGDHLDPSTLRTRYAAARDRAAQDDPELPRITFHGLRHCFGSRCAASGIDVVSIQRWMGHASIKTTQRYMHHSPSTDDARRLSVAFGDSGRAVAASRIAAF